tara:strand:+ start:685 stop:936 length:252 start_codon:yes stop_codon:yes gene_type:complete
VSKKKEMVDHPDHYNTGKIEVIDFIKDLGMAEDFCVGNAIKYISRYKHKENPLEDIKKAVWYLNYLVEILEKNKDQILKLEEK